MNEYTIYVTVDTNDGDYISQSLDITKDELDIIIRFINIIKDNNIRLGRGDASDMTIDQTKIIDDFCNEHEISIYDYLPYCEYGWHTLIEFKYAPIVTWTSLIN